MLSRLLLHRNAIFFVAVVVAHSMDPWKPRKKPAGIANAGTPVKS